MNNIADLPILGHLKPLTFSLGQVEKLFFLGVPILKQIRVLTDRNKEKYRYIETLMARTPIACLPRLFRTHL